MTIAEEQIDHLRECLDGAIGQRATATFMTMVQAVDTAQLATKSDLLALDRHTDLRITEIESRMDIRFTELERRMDIRFTELENRFDIKLEGMEDRITASMFSAINRHLTFSVMAMAAVSGMFTWLAR